MTLVVRKMEKKDMVEVEKMYEAKITSCTRNNFKGLYCFNTTGTILESITRATGTYEFLFTLVSNWPSLLFCEFVNFVTSRMSK